MDGHVSVPQQDTKTTKGRARLVKLLPNNIGGPLIGLALLVLVFSFSSDYFFSVVSKS